MELTLTSILKPRLDQGNLRRYLPLWKLTIVSNNSVVLNIELEMPKFVTFQEITVDCYLLDKKCENYSIAFTDTDDGHNLMVICSLEFTCNFTKHNIYYMAVGAVNLKL